MSEIETTVELIRKKGGELGFSEGAIEEAVDFARKFREASRSRYQSKSLAAGALYIASLLHDERKIQREITWALDCSEPSLRKAYKSMCKQLGLWNRIFAHIRGEEKQRGDKHKYKIAVQFCMWTYRRCIEDSWRLDETIPREKLHNPPFDCRDCVQRKKAPNFKENE